MPSSCISSSKARARSASTGACPRPPWGVMAPARLSCRPKPTVEGEREAERKQRRCHFFSRRNRTEQASLHSEAIKLIMAGSASPVAAPSEKRGHVSPAERRAHSREMSPVRAVMTPSLFPLIFPGASTL